MGTTIVTYQGIISSILETSRDCYELENPTLGSLLDSMSARHGYEFRKLIKDIPTCHVAVDGKPVDVNRDADIKLPDACQVDVGMALMTGVGCCG